MGLPPGHPITGIEMASLKTDLSNVGAKLADEQVLVDADLVTIEQA
jgi:hypothetical protein